MDYSVLVGLHFRDNTACDKMGLSPFVLRTGNRDSYQSEKFMRDCRFLEAELQDMDRVLSGQYVFCLSPFVLVRANFLVMIQLLLVIKEPNYSTTPHEHEIINGKKGDK